MAATDTAAIKLYKNSDSDKRVGINVLKTTSSLSYNLQVNGTANISGALSAGSLSLTTALPVNQGGTGATTKENARTNLGIGASGTHADSYFALASHTHTLSIATSSGTNQLTLAASTKYVLTAGGSTYIFTTPPNTTYESKTAASGGTAVSLVTTGEKYTWNNKSTLAIGTTSTTAAAGNHTHTLSIATSSGTNSITLAASTKYVLTAGGSTYVFTTPPNTTYSAGTGLSLSSTTFNISTVPVANGGTGATSASGARSNLGIGVTRLYSGSINSEGASFDISNANSYKFLIIGGYAYNTTNNAQTNVFVYTGELSSTERQYIISDDYDYHYIRFGVKLSGSTATVTIKSISGSGAALNAVYGVN